MGNPEARRVSRAFGLAPVNDPDAHDASLAARADTVAFGRIFHRHGARMHRLASKFLGPELADDAVQEIFVHAWERIAQFRGESLFTTWLHRLAVNALLRQSERARRIERRLLRTTFEHLPAREHRPDERLDLDAALAQLGEEVRAVVLLHDLEGYGHDDIAQIMGISISASKMRLHRGRMELREYLLP